MSDLLHELDNNIAVITLNRIDKHNAFDDKLLKELLATLHSFIANPHARVIKLKANGKHFSAGADLSWMQRMAEYSEMENTQDALILAEVMKTLHFSPKPTLAIVQGGAFGGGAGLVAASDIAIASTQSRFSFSEVKLGLIPAVISPYVVKAIGERAAKYLFMTAESFDAVEAKRLGLIHDCVDEKELDSLSHHVANTICRMAPLAVSECKTLVHQVANRPIDDALINETALLIAKKRVSEEGQRGLRAFLNKETPHWS